MLSPGASPSRRPQLPLQETPTSTSKMLPYSKSMPNAPSTPPTCHACPQMKARIRELEESYHELLFDKVFNSAEFLPSGGIKEQHQEQQRPTKRGRLDEDDEKVGNSLHGWPSTLPQNSVIHQLLQSLAVQLQLPAFQGDAEECALILNRALQTLADGFHARSWTETDLPAHQASMAEFDVHWRALHALASDWQTRCMRSVATAPSVQVLPRSSMASQTDQVADWNALRTEHQAVLAELSATIQSLTEEVNAKTLVEHQLREKLKGLRSAESEDGQVVVVDERSLVDLVQLPIDLLRQTQSQLQLANEQHASAVSQLWKRLQVVIEERDQLRQALESLVRESQAANAAHRTITDRLVQCVKSIQKHSQSTARFQAVWHPRIMDSLMDVQGHRQFLSTVRNWVDQCSRDLESFRCQSQAVRQTLHAELSHSFQGQLRQMSSALDEKSRELSSRLDRLRELESESQSWVGKETELLRLIESKSCQLQSLQSNLDTVQRELQLESHSTTKMASQVQSLQDQMTRLQDEKAAATLQVQQLKGQFQEQRMEKEQLVQEQQVKYEQAWREKEEELWKRFESQQADHARELEELKSKLNEVSAAMVRDPPAAMMAPLVQDRSLTALPNYNTPNRSVKKMRQRSALSKRSQVSSVADESPFMLNLASPQTVEFVSNSPVAKFTAPKVIAFSGFRDNHAEYDATLKATLTDLIETLGGSVSGNHEIDDKVTHVITAPNSRTLKTFAACLTSKWLITDYNWLYDSKEQGAFLPEDRYGRRYFEKPFLKRKFCFTAEFINECSGGKVFRVENARNLIGPIGGGMIVSDPTDADFILCAMSESRLSERHKCWTEFIGMIPGSKV